MDHKYKVRIYYEDTDAGGVVFYANYFKFTERARTELIYEKLKLKHLELKDKFDVIFVVKSLSSKYIAPAKFEDDLTVVSRIVEKSQVRLILDQNIEKGNKLIFTSTIELAVVSSKGKILIKKIIKGEDVDLESSGLSKREWNELMEEFNLQDKKL